MFVVCMNVFKFMAGCGIFAFVISSYVPCFEAVDPFLLTAISFYIVDPLIGLLVTTLIVLRLLQIRRRHEILFG
jgi:hypothetical protein